MASTLDNSVMTELPAIPQETLDSLILTPEAKAHYSQENELKKLLIECETYKRAYESQQKSINEFIKKCRREEYNLYYVKTIKFTNDIVNKIKYIL